MKIISKVEARSPIRHDIGLDFETPQRHPPVKSTFEETGGLGGTVHVSNTDTTTNLGEYPITTIPKKAVVIPPEVSITDSVSEEVRTSGIIVDISNMDKNNNTGEGMKQSEAHGTSSVEPSSISITFVLSSTIKTTLIDTFTSLPSFSSPIPSSLPMPTIPPTFSNILHQDDEVSSRR